MEQNRPLGWTTLEEAKLLVDAGLDPNTADMFYTLVDQDIYATQPLPNDNIVFRRKQEDVPCWSLGSLIEISIKIIENDYYFLSSAKDFAYSHLLNSERELMQKYDNFTEATVCFLLDLLKQTIKK